jgi:hypothetical protein
MQNRAGGADVLDPVAVVAVQDLRVHAGNHPFGIRQGEGGVVRTPDRAAALVEPADERLTHRCLIERNAMQDQRHG